MVKRCNTRRERKKEKGRNGAADVIHIGGAAAAPDAVNRCGENRSSDLFFLLESGGCVLRRGGVRECVVTAEQS
jgi:hypothetical protein